MKRSLLLIIYCLSSYFAFSQAATLYQPSTLVGADSIILTASINATPRRVYAIDLVKFRAAKVAHDTAEIIRLLISTSLAPYLTASLASSLYYPNSNPNGYLQRSDTTSYLRASDTVNTRLRLTEGSNVTITGTFPNYTISASGGGGGIGSEIDPVFIDQLQNGMLNNVIPAHAGYTLGLSTKRWNQGWFGSLESNNAASNTLTIYTLTDGIGTNKYLTTDANGAAVLATLPTSGSGSGNVSTVSVVTANGFSGTVTNPTTTPAITIVADTTLFQTRAYGNFIASQKLDTQKFLDTVYALRTRVNASVKSFRGVPDSTAIIADRWDGTSDTIMRIDASAFAFSITQPNDTTTMFHLPSGDSIPLIISKANIIGANGVSVVSSSTSTTIGLGNISPLSINTVGDINASGNITSNNLSGVNSGDETGTSIRGKIGSASTSNSGYLASTDWNTFSAKLGPSTTTSSIAPSTNRNYVTDAQQTVIGNTSNTNTGDETATTIRTKIGAASASNSGYLTLGDWSTFNGKTTAAAVYTSDSLSFLNRTGKLVLSSDPNLEAYGTSFTAGVGASDATNKGFSAIVAGKFGKTLFNRGWSGAGDTWINLLFNLNTGATTTRSFMIEMGINTARFANVKSVEKYKANLTNMIAGIWNATGVAGNSGSITKTGAWTTLASGAPIQKRSTAYSGSAIFTNTAGATASYTFTGNDASIGTYITDNIHRFSGSFDYYVDNIKFGTYSTGGKADNVADANDSGYLANAAVILTNLGSGSHTIKITTLTTDTTYLDFFSVMKPASTASPILVATLPKLPVSANTNYQSYVGIFNDTLRSIVSSLAGYPITIADQYNTLTKFSADSLHPSDEGHRQTASSFEARVNPISAIDQNGGSLVSGGILSFGVGSKILLYNANDATTTNYERLNINASSNVLKLDVESGGTGVMRDLRIASMATYSNSSNGFRAQLDMGSSGTQFFEKKLGTLSSTSLVQYFDGIFPTINQVTSTGGYTGIYLSAYEQSLGSGAKFLINAGINTAAAGGGTHTSKFTVSNTGVVTASGALTASGITSTAAISASTSITAGGTGAINWSSRSKMLSPSDGTMLFQNNAATAFTALQFGGTTASFPELLVNGTGLDAKLADNSAFTVVQSLYDRVGAGSPEGVVAAPVSAHYHRTDGSTGTAFYVKETGGSTSTGWVAK